MGAALTLVYVVAGKLGLMLAFVHASAMSIPPGDDAEASCCTVALSSM